MNDYRIAQVFDKLVELHLCRSRTSFSRDWLGREASYYRSVNARRGTISFGAHAHLVQSLRNIGSAFSMTGVPQTESRGRTLLDLSDVCLSTLLERAAINAYVAE